MITTHSKREALANRVQELRKGQDLSRLDLALGSGVSADTIEDIEKMRVNPGFDILVKLADYFNMSLSEFFDGV